MYCLSPEAHKSLFSIQLSVRKPVLKPTSSTLLWLDRDWTSQTHWPFLNCSIMISPGSSLLFFVLGLVINTMYKDNIPKALEASLKPFMRIWLTSSIEDISWADQHPLFLVPFLTSWVMQYFNTGLIWRPKAVNCVVPTQWTTYESECLTCLHCQLLPRGNSGWWILSFLPVTHQKDNSFFLRSARNSWKALLLKSLPGTTSAHSRVVSYLYGSGFVTGYLFFFFLWDCEEKQTLIFSISSVPSLRLTFIFLGSVVVLFISTWVQSSSSWLLAQSQVSSCPCPIKRYTSPSPLAEQPFPSAPVLALHGGIHIRGTRKKVAVTQRGDVIMSHVWC